MQGEEFTIRLDNFARMLNIPLAKAQELADYGSIPTRRDPVSGAIMTTRYAFTYYRAKSVKSTPSY